MLWKGKKNPIYKLELLDSQKLDFSLESLRHLDEYLRAVYQDLPDEGNKISVALRCGAYLGEVIRKHSDKEFHWYDFEQASMLSNFMKEEEMSLGTSAVLVADKNTICFPILKIIKYLENGPGDSTYMFGYFCINSSPESNK